MIFSLVICFFIKSVPVGIYLIIIGYNGVLCLRFSPHASFYQLLGLFFRSGFENTYFLGIICSFLLLRSPLKLWINSKMCVLFLPASLLTSFTSISMLVFVMSDLWKGCEGHSGYAHRSLGCSGLLNPLVRFIGVISCPPTVERCVAGGIRITLASF